MFRSGARPDHCSPGPSLTHSLSYHPPSTLPMWQVPVHTRQAPASVGSPLVGREAARTPGSPVHAAPSRRSLPGSLHSSGFRHRPDAGPPTPPGPLPPIHGSVQPAAAAACTRAVQQPGAAHDVRPCVVVRRSSSRPPPPLGPSCPAPSCCCVGPVGTVSCSWRVR